MSMSKKDFVKLAEAFRDGKEWESARDNVASVCKSANAQFDRERWLSYIAGDCGPSGGKRAKRAERAS